MIKNTKQKTDDSYIAFLFIIIPTILILLGVVFFSSEFTEEIRSFLAIPLFTSLVLLGVGGFYKKQKNIAHKLKIFGWSIFGFYWSTQTVFLFEVENGDYFNAGLCIIGVYVLFYFAYHEWLSLKRNENLLCLNWIAASSAIAGFIYFGIELTSLNRWLIEIVAQQSAFVLNMFIGNVEAHGVNIFWNDSYVITIIFACTAVQSMVIFIGMILPLPKVNLKRKIIGLLITVVPIYFLNLFRNALIAFLVKDNPDMFSMAHNVIGKGLSLLALVVLLFIVIKIVPEVFDMINGLIDLPKRGGPIEKIFKKPKTR